MGTYLQYLNEYLFLINGLLVMMVFPKRAGWYSYQTVA